MSILKIAAVTVVVGSAALLSQSAASASPTDGDSSPESGVSIETPPEPSNDLNSAASGHAGEADPGVADFPTCSQETVDSAEGAPAKVDEPVCTPESAIPAEPAGIAPADSAATPNSDVETGAAVAAANPSAAVPLDESVAAPTQTFSNCDQARAAGYTNIPAGSPGYSASLDRDNDGIACDDESAPSSSSAATGSAQTQPTQTLPVTGAASTLLAVIAFVLLALGMSFSAAGAHLKNPLTGRVRGGFTYTYTDRAGQVIVRRVATSRHHRSEVTRSCSSPDSP